MKDGFVLLTEKEQMWARMLTDLLEDNHIPCATLPVQGAGFSVKTGIQDRLKVYVPAEKLPQATELLEALFSADILPEEDAEL